MYLPLQKLFSWSDVLVVLFPFKDSNKVHHVLSKISGLYPLFKKRDKFMTIIFILYLEMMVEHLGSVYFVIVSFGVPLYFVRRAFGTF